MRACAPVLTPNIADWLMALPGLRAVTVRATIPLRVAFERYDATMDISPLLGLAFAPAFLFTALPARLGFWPRVAEARQLLPVPWVNLAIDGEAPLSSSSPVPKLGDKGRPDGGPYFWTLSNV
jgi:hypothetical protein